MGEDIPRCNYRWCESDHSDPADDGEHFEEFVVTPSLADAIVELRDGLTRLLDTYRSWAVIRGLVGLPTPRQVAERHER